jgi:hypothetical protein
MVITKNSTRYQLFLRTRIVLLLLFVVSVGAQAKAQTFQSTSSYPMTQQSYQAQEANQVGSYQAYESTIYEPFTSANPSSNGNNAPAGITNRKNDFGHPENENPGTGPTEPPIGEPWIMLAFAAMAAVVITLRKKQTA